MSLSCSARRSPTSCSLPSKSAKPSRTFWASVSPWPPGAPLSERKNLRASQRRNAFDRTGQHSRCVSTGKRTTPHRCLCGILDPVGVERKFDSRLACDGLATMPLRRPPGRTSGKRQESGALFRSANLRRQRRWRRAQAPRFACPDRGRTGADHSRRGRRAGRS